MGRIATGLMFGLALAGAQVIAQSAPLTEAQIAEFRKGAYPTTTKGLTLPAVLKEAKPIYTPEGMREKIQGDVMLEAIVGADGKVARVRVTKSLNAPSGLDQSAMDAAKAWLFKPGMLDGKPVPVIVQLVLNFSLH